MFLCWLGVEDDLGTLSPQLPEEITLCRSHLPQFRQRQASAPKHIRVEERPEVLSGN